MWGNIFLNTLCALPRPPPLSRACGRPCNCHITPLLAPEISKNIKKPSYYDVGLFVFSTFAQRTKINRTVQPMLLELRHIIGEDWWLFKNNVFQKMMRLARGEYLDNRYTSSTSSCVVEEQAEEKEPCQT